MSNYEVASGRVTHTLELLRAMDPTLAEKVQPAGQLALFQEAAGPMRAAKQHTWRFVGQQKTGALYQCTRCPATMRTTRRFERALTTYSLDGKRYAKARPACEPISRKKEGA